MGVFLDPITGLPVSSLPGSIDQLPMVQQPIPYADWTTQQSLNRVPFYPDDAPGVLATVSGQHENTLNAQSVMTDGEHNLRVKVVNQAGGSTNLIPQAQGAGYSFVDGAIGSFGAWPVGHDLLYGCSYNFMTTDSSFSVPRYREMILGISGTFGQIDLELIHVYVARFLTDPATPETAVNGVLMLPGPINLAGLFPTPDGVYYIAFHSFFTGEGHVTPYTAA